MDEDQALEMFARLSRKIRQTPSPSKRQVRNQNPMARLESPNMRTVGRQTKDAVRAIYDNGGMDRSMTPVAKPDTKWWDADFHVIEYRAGKDTQSR
jgi:hypothetical protein